MERYISRNLDMGVLGVQTYLPKTEGTLAVVFRKEKIVFLPHNQNNLPMKKLLTLTLCLALGLQSVLACTNLIVGKKASADGSVMCT